jgi:hypothetical protein
MRSRSTAGRGSIASVLLVLCRLCLLLVLLSGVRARRLWDIGGRFRCGGRGRTFWLLSVYDNLQMSGRMSLP